MKTRANFLTIDSYSWFIRLISFKPQRVNKDPQKTGTQSHVLQASVKRELNEKPKETSNGTAQKNFRKCLKWNQMINVLLAVQLRPKSFIKAKQCLVFAKVAEKYDQKAGFEKVSPKHMWTD